MTLLQTKPAPKTGEQEMAKLEQRFTELNKRKIQAETSLDHARQQLAALQKEAREKYGTDDVIALRKQLDTLTAENEAKRKAYQAELNGIEEDLKDVEGRFATPEG